MKEPTFDRNGCPTEETLEAIKKWPIGKFSKLLPFCEQAWNHTYGRIEKAENKESLFGDRVFWEFFTGGWSGNESIIEAMDENENMFWDTFWQKSERGGLHVFGECTWKDAQ